MKTGKVFLVGAGPGDPGLLTLRGARLIAEADVIVMDALVSPRLVRGVRAQVIDAGKRGPGKENERAHGPSQNTINRLLLRLARSGKTVVRLKGGDPFVFGRGSEEIEALRAARIPFEVVPGVTSASAVPAYAGIPVTDRRWASQVTFVTGHERPGKESSIDWARLSPSGTLVVLMGVRSWPSLARELLSNGWASSVPVAAIERGATPDQRVILSTLRESSREFSSKKLLAPAIIIVGRVAGLSKRLAWLARERPLFGRRIVVTRAVPSMMGMNVGTAPASMIRSNGAVEANDRLAALLDAEGADTISCPLIRVQPLSSASLDTLRLASSAVAVPYDWLIFLSANAVRIFNGLWPDAARKLAHVPVAAIGPQTAQAATAAGWRVRRTPSVFTSEAVRRALGPLRNKRLLLPRARIAPAGVVRNFEKAGATVDVLPIYDTEFVRPSASARSDMARGADALTFLSASSVAAFAAAFSASERRRLLKSTAVFSIGTMTSAAVRRQLGVRPHQARVSTAEGVIDEMRRFFASK